MSNFFCNCNIVLKKLSAAEDEWEGVRMSERDNYLNIVLKSGVNTIQTNDSCGWPHFHFIKPLAA